MELRGRHIAAEGGVCQIGAAKQSFGFFHRGALAQDPRDQLELGHVVGIGDGGIVVRIAQKVQAGHGEATVVEGVEVQGIILQHQRHAQNGVVGVQDGEMAELQREMAGRQGDTFAVGHGVVQRPAHIKVSGLIGHGCAHSSLLVMIR